jgi:hypothetical protein
MDPSRNEQTCSFSPFQHQQQSRYNDQDMIQLESSLNKVRSFDTGTKYDTVVDILKHKPII